MVTPPNNGEEDTTVRRAFERAFIRCDPSSQSELYSTAMDVLRGLDFRAFEKYALFIGTPSPEDLPRRVYQYSNDGLQLAIMRRS